MCPTWTKTLKRHICVVWFLWWSVWELSLTPARKGYENFGGEGILSLFIDYWIPWLTAECWATIPSLLCQISAFSAAEHVSWLVCACVSWNCLIHKCFCRFTAQQIHLKLPSQLNRLCSFILHSVWLLIANLIRSS